MSPCSCRRFFFKPCAGRISVVSRSMSGLPHSITCEISNVIVKPTLASRRPSAIASRIRAGTHTVFIFADDKWYKVKLFSMMLHQVTGGVAISQFVGFAQPVCQHYKLEALPQFLGFRLERNGSIPVPVESNQRYFASCISEGIRNPAACESALSCIPLKSQTQSCRYTLQSIDAQKPLPLKNCSTGIHSPHRLMRRSLKALVMTDTELKLIAAAAIIGDSSIPKKGYKTPAATGTPSML